VPRQAEICSQITRRFNKEISNFNLSKADFVSIVFGIFNDGQPTDGLSSDLCGSDLNLISDNKKFLTFVDKLSKNCCF